MVRLKLPCYRGVCSRLTGIIPRRCPSITRINQQSSDRTISYRHAVCCAFNFIVRFVVLFPSFILTTFRSLRHGVVSLSGRLLVLCKAFIVNILLLPRLILNLIHKAYSCLHPKNLRQMSVGSMVQKSKEAFWTFKTACAWKHLKQIFEQKVLKKWDARVCIGFMKRLVIMTVCLSCGLLLLAEVLSEDGQTTGLRIFRGRTVGRRFQTPEPKVRRVVIVEEHHEALKYWYEAVESGLLPNTGLTLLHFGSHPGTSALDHVTDDFPQFHWPTNLNELYQMMQESDNYVTAAIFTKLIKRYIWVWPSWNERNLPNDSEYEAYGIYIGWAKRTTPDGRLGYKEICGCLVNEEFKDCRVRNTTHPKLAPMGISIPQDLCNILHRGVIEIVRDDVAQDKLETEVDWIKPDEPMILDIDADFYGSIRPVTQLIKVGLTQDLFTNLSAVVGKILCPRTVLQEKSADRIIIKIIDSIQKYRYCKFHKCVDQMKFLKLRQVVVNIISDAEADPDFYAMFCSHNRRKHQFFLDELITLFVKLTTSQLHKLRSVGFCFRTSPKSFDFSPRGSFGLCSGKPYLGIPRVSFYSPSKQAVMNRTYLLQETLYDGVINPKFVTISRSVREGYAPREHITLIENHLLATVHQVLNKNTTAVHYDKDLYGGMFGWQSRDQVLITDNQMWENMGNG